MKASEFEELYNNLHDTGMEIMRSKRPGYTIGSDDALANFKRVAKLAQNTPEDNVITYMVKHWDSILAFIRHPEIEQAEDMIQRFADLQNYTCLLLALLIESGRIENPYPQTTQEN
jgi:hypothetical protein